MDVTSCRKGKSDMRVSFMIRSLCLATTMMPLSCQLPYGRRISRHVFVVFGTCMVRFASLQECQTVLGAFDVHAENAEPKHVDETADGPYCHDAGFADMPSTHAFEDLLTRVGSMTDLYQKPVFVDTWFLAANRFHLCIRPRKVRVASDSNFGSFKNECRRVWSDLDDGTHIRLIHVQGASNRLPGIIEHWIVLQGNPENQAAALFDCVSFPIPFEKESCTCPTL